MSIERFGDLYTPTCDRCGLELPTEFEFYDAVQVKKDADWKSRKDKFGWEDVCPNC